MKKFAIITGLSLLALVASTTPSPAPEPGMGGNNDRGGNSSPGGANSPGANDSHHDSGGHDSSYPAGHARNPVRHCGGPCDNARNDRLNGMVNGSGRYDRHGNPHPGPRGSTTGRGSGGWGSRGPS